MKTVIGIDPGKGGGIAWIADGKPVASKMPETLQDLWDFITKDILHATGNYHFDKASWNTIAYIESVHSSPQMGVKSAFTFGQGYGNLEMALTAARIPFVRVSPQRWQKALGCMSKGDKNVTKRRAQELFPHLKITHATADALLIAHYGLLDKQPTQNYKT